jgi:hypothetical protein
MLKIHMVFFIIAHAFRQWGLFLLTSFENFHEKGKSNTISTWKVNTKNEDHNYDIVTTYWQCIHDLYWLSKQKKCEWKGRHCKVIQKNSSLLLTCFHFSAAQNILSVNDKKGKISENLY